MKNAHQSRLNGKFHIPAALAAAGALALGQQAHAATTYEWNVASGNWNAPASWSPATSAAGPTSADSALFGNITYNSSSSSTVNNTVNVPFTITGLTYNTVATSPSYNVTQIGTGETLTVTGPVLVGGQNEGAGGYTTYAYMTGGGTFVATGTPFAVQNYGSVAGANAIAYLNLSGLSYFVYNNSAGTISIEDNISGSQTRLGGNLTLASVSNYITAASINLGTTTAAQAGPAGTLTLGPGTNVINVGAFNIAEQKSTMSVLGAAPGGVTIRGLTGNNLDGNVTITIGDRTVSGGTTTMAGSMLLNGCPVDIMTKSLIVGANGGGTSGIIGAGTLQFDTGVIVATNVFIADGPDTASGTVSVGAAATLDIGTGGLSLVTQGSGQTCSGTLNIALGGTVNSSGDITESAATASGTGTINLGGTLAMAANTTMGTTGSPVTILNVTNGASLQFTIPSTGVINATAATVNWPSPDNNVHFNITELPAGSPSGTTFTLLTATTAFNNSETAANLSLPGGVTGNLSQSGNSIILTLTSPVSGPPGVPTDVEGTAESAGIVLTWEGSGDTSYAVYRSTSPNGPWTEIASNVDGTTYTDTTSEAGLDDVYYQVVGININGTSNPSSTDAVPLPYASGNELLNPGFELDPLKVDWTVSGNTPVISVGTATYYNAGVCPADSPAELVVSHGGTNVGNIYGNVFSGGAANTSYWRQQRGTTGGSTWNAGGWTYASHEDLMTGDNAFYYEVDFLNASGTLLSAYRSFVVTNLTCDGPNTFPLDTWVYLTATNEIQVTDGANTGVVIGSTPGGVVTAPVGTATVQWQATYYQINNAGGSIYLDDAELNLVSGPIGPTVTTPAPLAGLTLCTNTTLSVTATGAQGATISEFQVTTVTSSIGSTASVTNTSTYNVNSAVVSGLGTTTATLNYPLASNFKYTSVTISATDNNGVVSSTSEGNFDTFAPALVIEATDYNYNGGQFINTPTNGGIYLYDNLPSDAIAGVDYYKSGAQGPDAPTYRDVGVTTAPYITNAGADTYTEQKYVVATTGANIGMNDFPELSIGYDTASPGDWQDYTRTFGASGTVSAAPGTYNVWLYMAISGAGNVASLSTVTPSPVTSSSTQTTNHLGQFGISTFSETDWNGFEYVPLTDQYGSLLSISVASGIQTFRLQVGPQGNPNLGFFMLMPATGNPNPGFKYVYPDATHPFEATNYLTFTVTPNQGGPIASSGIQLTLNGVNVTSGLALTQTSGTNWTGNYPILSNAVYTALITVTNENGDGASLPLSFDTFSTNNYQWEAVDYDFSTNNGTFSTPPAQGNEMFGGWVSALHIDCPSIPEAPAGIPTGDITGTGTTGPLGTEATNSYFGYPAGFTSAADPAGAGAIAQQGVDVNFVSAGQTAAYELYRFGDGVGAQVATDWLRPKFAISDTTGWPNQIPPVTADPNVGIFNLCYMTTGDWLNYTHKYPAGNYYVWARLANSTAYNSSFGEVTNGVGTGTQTVEPLGIFTDNNAAGYQAWHWIPLVNASGMPVVVSLNGQTTTFRVTANDGQNMEFFMLAPAPAVAGPLQVTATLVSGQIQLSFATVIGYSYQIQYKSSLTGTWVPVGSAIPGTGNVQVATESVAGAQGFYQVSVQ